MSKNVLLVSNTDGAMFKFRGNLIERLGKLGYLTTCVVSPSSPEGSYIDRLSRICSSVRTVDFVRQSNFKVFVSFFKIWWISKKLRPEIIHVFGHEAAIFSLIALLLDNYSKKIVTITGLGRYFGQRNDLRAKILQRLILWSYSILLLKIDNIFFLNSHDLGLFLKFFPKSSGKFKIIFGEGSSFEPSLAFNYPDSDFSYLFASRIMEEKGILELLEAFENLPDQFKLTVLGTVDESLADHPRIIDLLAGKVRNVNFKGFQDDIRPFLSRCSCLILPSKYMEGLPIILVEALSMGKLIITSNAPGCSETVVDGINGALIEDVTAGSIAEAVRRVALVDSVSAHAFSTNLFCSRFSSDVILDQIIEVYSTC